MKRREFITLLGGAAAAWPLAVSALWQGLSGRNAHRATRRRSENAARLAAFRLALGKFGWSEGRNLLIDIRWGAGDPDRMRVLAKELNRLGPEPRDQRDRG